MKRISAACILITLAACAPVTQRVHVDQAAIDAEARHQRTLALQGLLADQIRLYRVSYPLLKSSREFCKDNVRNRIGVLLMNKHSLGKLAEVADTQGLGEEIKAVAVVAGSPAAAAGLQVNDILVRMNGEPGPANADGSRAFLEQMTDALKTGAPVVFEMRRGGNTVTVTVPPEPTCNYRVQMSDQTVINAFADGKQVTITRGMMRFAATDTELSLVISHEIAHNTMKHIDAQLGNRVIGAILDAVIAGLTRTPSTGAFANAAGQAYSQDFEAEADYVGLYIMARAGQPIREAPLFWRRMAAESPASIGNNHAASHPPTSYRLLALDKTVQEIETLQKAGKPLLPRMK